MSTQDPERRTVLRGVLAAGCALWIPMAAATERSSGTTQKSSGTQSGKMTKEQSKYQDQPKGDQKCANCMHFVAQSSTCNVVEGKVSANGWCMLWAKKA